MSASPLKFPDESILSDLGYPADRAPPREKRPDGAELCWCAVGNFYRFPTDAERRAEWGFFIAIERMNRKIAW